MAGTTIDNLQIEISTESEKAASDLEKWIETMEKLKASVEKSSPALTELKKNFEKISSTGVAGKMKEIGDSIKKSQPDYSSLSSVVGDVGKSFSALPPSVLKAAQAAATAETAMQKLSGVKITPTLEQATASLDDLKASLSNTSGKMGAAVGDVDGVVKAFAALPPEVQKSITASAKMNTALDKAENGFDKAKKAGLSFGDVLKANIFSDVIINSAQALGNAVADIGRNFMDFAKTGVETASNLQEVQNVVDTTFGGSASSVDSFAKSAAASFGLSELSAKQFSGTMGAMLKSMNLDDSAVLEMSTSLAGLAGDMASFYNLDAQEAFDKLRSGISGEAEPLKALGINLSAANLEAYALSQGITTAYSAMTEAEKATLRYGYLMQATADAQGDFARTSDGFANQQRILQLNMENLGASIGQTLLPYLNELATAFNGMFTGETNLAEFGEAVGGVISNIATGIINNLPYVAEAAKSIFGTIGSTIRTLLPQLAPVGISILNEIALGIISSLPYIVSTGAELITSVALGIAQFLPELIPTVVDVVLQIADTLTQPDTLVSLISASLLIITAVADGLIQAVPLLLERAPIIIANLSDAFTLAAPQILTAGVTLIAALGTGLINAIPKLIQNIPQIIAAIVTGITDGITAIKDAGSNILVGVKEGIMEKADWLKEQITGFFSGIVDDVKGVLGIHSPSTVFASIGQNLLMGLGDGISKNETSLLSTVGDWMSGVTGKVSQALSSFSLGGGFTEMGAGAAQGWIEGFNAIFDIVPQSQTVLTNMKADITIFSRDVQLEFSNLASGIKTQFSNLSSAVKTELGGLVSSMGPMFREMANDSIAAIEDIIDALNDIPRNITTTHTIIEKSKSSSSGDDEDGWVVWENPNIKSYATGGYPTVGQLFYARESGPELVGTIGGSPAVVNNNQIVEAVSVGVANAVAEVMGNSGDGNINIVVTLDGEKIYDNQQRIKARRGYNIGLNPSFSL